MENDLYFKINKLNKVNVGFILLYKGKYKGKLSLMRLVSHKHS